MNDYQIVTDACCDMNADILDRLDIKVIPMEVAMSNGEHFLHYPDFRNYAPKAFYDKIREGVTASTSQISPVQYETCFREILEKGKDVLYICLSSGLSGSFQTSLLACRSLEEEFPDAKIVCVDSLCACAGQGLLAIKAAENKRYGLSLEENAKWLEQGRLRIEHFYTVGNLDALRRGGRIPAAAARIGNLLRIRPVMFVDDQGKLELLKRVRGRRASLELLVSSTVSRLNPGEKTIYLSHTDCQDEVDELRELTQKALPSVEIVCTRIGPVIGAHTGEECICLFSFGSGKNLRLRAKE